MKKTQPQRSSSAMLTGSPALYLAVILFLACLLRFSGIASTPPGLCYDESINGLNILEAIESGSWKVFYPENYGREGLFINIQGAFVKLVTTIFSGGRLAVEPWMLRFPSAVFGVLTVAGLYLLTNALTRNRVAASASAFFLATSFWHVNFSRIGFRAITAPFWLVWALYFLIAGFQDTRDGKRRKGLLKLAAAGLCYGAGFHSYIAYRVTPAIVAAALIWLIHSLWKANRGREALAGAAVFAVAAALVAAPLVVYYMQHPGSFEGRAEQVSVLKSQDPVRGLLDNSWKTALMFNVEGDHFWRHNIAGRPQLFLPVGLLFLAGIALTIRNLASKEARGNAFPGLFAVLWLVVAALPAILSTGGIPHALRGLTMAPACFLLAGLAAEFAWNWLNSRYSRGTASACAGALALLLTWECYSSYFGTFAQSPQLQAAFEVEWSEVGREINALPDSAPKYVIMPGWKLDSRGVPDAAYPLAVVTGSHSAKGREKHRIRFVVDREEAERVSREEGAYIFVIQSK